MELRRPPFSRPFWLAWVLPARWRLHDTLTMLALGMVVALCWAWLLTGAGMLMPMGGMLMPMSSGAWTPREALLMFLMWVTMMAAMMLPSVVPTVLLYCAVTRNHRLRIRALESTAFVAGYLGVWTLFSLAATGVQYLLEQAAILDSMMQMSSVAVAAFVLISVGFYQWTPLKQSCLSKCQSPLDALMPGWKPGSLGALRMGTRNGLQCLGCCWAWMLLLFVVGVMSLGWIAGLALLMAIEKLTPLGAMGSKLTGLVLVGWGSAMLLFLR